MDTAIKFLVLFIAIVMAVVCGGIITCNYCHVKEKEVKAQETRDLIHTLQDIDVTINKFIHNRQELNHANRP